MWFLFGYDLFSAYPKKNYIGAVGYLGTWTVRGWVLGPSGRAGKEIEGIESLEACCRHLKRLVLTWLKS